MRGARGPGGLIVLVSLLAACESASVQPAMANAPPPPAPPAPILAATDSDRDGVSDAYDACPTLPGVASPILVSSGCPPPGYYDDGLGTRDRDGDSVQDDVDACPEDPGAPETKGCAAPPDSDRDGVADALDACRDEAGPARDDAHTTGCPAAWVEGDRVRILDGVRFSSGSAELLTESAPVLDGVAMVLARRADITKVRVEGHTDGRGGATMNRRLSVQRAASVVAYLVTHGVASLRLEAEGIGPDRPIDTNETEAGRATNRRVEFHVLSITPPPAETRTTASFADLEPGLPAPLPAPGGPAAPAPVSQVPGAATPSLDSPGL